MGDFKVFDWWEKLGIGALSFFIPPVGFILAIIWWKDYDYSPVAPIALVCALIPTVLILLVCGLSLLFGVVAAGNLI